VRGVIVEDLVVDLIGEDDEPVLAGDLNEIEQEIGAVDRAGRVIRVDDDDSLGPRGDLLLDVLEIRVPVGRLVAHVVDGPAACQVDGSGPERVVRSRDKDLVAVVEECLHGLGDKLRAAVADEDIVHVCRAQPLLLIVLCYRLAGDEESLGVAVACVLGKVGDYVADDLLRRLESERRQVADIELEDPVPFIFETAGLFMNLAANVIADIVELVRLIYIHLNYQPIKQANNFYYTR